jgi:hypothetical protein
VFGKQDTAAINLSVIAAGKNTVGFVIKGESRHDYSGFSVSSAGDVNDSPLITKPPVPVAMADNSMGSDGLDDLIIGAHNAGKSYVVFGKQVSCLPNTTYDLASLVPTIKSSKPSPLTSPALETECPLKSVDFQYPAQVMSMAMA